MPSVFVNRPPAQTVTAEPFWIAVDGYYIAAFGADGAFITERSPGTFSMNSNSQLAWDGSGLYLVDSSATLHQYDPTSLVQTASSTVLTDGTDPVLAGDTGYGIGLAPASSGHLFTSHSSTPYGLAELSGFTPVAVHSDTRAVPGGQIGSNGTTLTIPDASNSVTVYDSTTAAFSSVTLAVPPLLGTTSPQLLRAVMLSTGELWASWTDSGVGFFMARHAADGTVTAQWDPSGFTAAFGLSADHYVRALDIQANDDLLFLTKISADTDAAVCKLSAADNSGAVIVPSITAVGIPLDGGEYDGTLCARRA